MESPWKLALIERLDPGWRNLFDEFAGTTSDPEAEAARFIAELKAAKEEEQKRLDPRLRGDER